MARPWLVDLSERSPKETPSGVGRHRDDLVGVVALAGLIVVSTLLASAWNVGELAILAGLAVGLWRGGPKIGFDRRAAVLVPVPILNLFVIIPAIWRWAHRAEPTRSGPLEPSWGRVAWSVMSIVGIGIWLVYLAAAIVWLA